MSLQSDDLLTGPRGRRLCLAFALQGWDPRRGPLDGLREAVFFASFALDPGRGTSARVLFGAGADQPPPQPSPKDVGRILEDVPLAETNERTLLFSLTAAVDNARYWQEPDGEDILATTPEVRAALVRVAEAITASSSAAWWADSMDEGEQWEVTFTETAGTGTTRATKTALETLEAWPALQIEEELAASRDRPINPEANWSGTWWSKPPTGLPRTTRALEGRGPVALWLVEDGLGWKAATAERIHLPVDARVYEIDGPAAWAELCRRYPMEVTASRRHDWYRTTGRNSRWVIPDWAQVQHDHDAVHLTVGGYLTTAGRAIPVDDDLATVLAGWDPDQTYWLRDLAHDTSTRQTWTYDRDREIWQLGTSR
ncbi:hypothetical protein [Salinibacterium sp. ZJ450]|uniref:hypothetical protein n=1 Tax=Salinibacterium sp. ZJ450 TaxID=2708338 RepID=UPI00141F7497|nr:hypothetical protein [Salinibacterium sp. ZJ450]